MGSVGDTWICSLCRRWAPYAGHPLYDSCSHVPMGCWRCRKRFDAGGVSWQEMFLLQPLQKLCFCDKQPMKNSRQVWILIVEFIARQPFRGKAMPTGVPLFLWYDDMVCPDRGPDDLFMRFPQIPKVPKISFGERPPFPPPLGKCRASLQLTRSRSAPAHLCGIWRHLPPRGHTKRFEVLIETLLRPNPRPEPLLIKPSSRPAADHFRFALGWPCKPDAIWALRTNRTKGRRCYQPWRCRKMKWRVEQEAAERRMQPARPSRAEPSIWASHIIFGRR